MKRRIITLALALGALGMLGSLQATCPIGPPCPIHDGLTGLSTGRTTIVDGVTLMEYRCIGGHTFWARC